MAITRISKGVLVALVAGVALAALTSSAAADDGSYEFRIVCKSGKVVIDTFGDIGDEASDVTCSAAKRRDKVLGHHLKAGAGVARRGNHSVGSDLGVPELPLPAPRGRTQDCNRKPGPTRFTNEDN